MNSVNTILKYLEYQAQLIPEAAAIKFRDKTISYGELDHRSGILASEFQTRSLVTGTHVLVYMERSPEIIIAMMAIFKAGLIYVPMDTAYPIERLNFIIENNPGSCLLVDRADLGTIKTGDNPIIEINRYSDYTERESRGHDLSYIIYTSGSTGRPKGTVVSHESLLASSETRLNYYGPIKNVLLIPSFAFDASLAAICWTLLSGGCLIIAEESVLKSSSGMRLLLENNHINALLCVPSYYRFLLDEQVFLNASQPDIVILGGEGWDISLAEKHFECLPDCQLYNEYGPTECTIWATVDRIFPGEQITIGRPVTGVEVALLDEALLPVSFDGGYGEIYISGIHLAAGYLQMADLESNSFPFINGKRFYRTGDIAQYNNDGKLIFGGRIDEQVKISGHRIELGEIEQVFNGIEHILETRVLLTTDNNPAIIGFYKADDKRAVNDAVIRKYLQERLPEYMIPSKFIRVEGFPLTANGKLDKVKLLSSISYADVHSLTDPETICEHNVLECWIHLFQRKEISVEQDFTELGGSSLLAMRMVSYLSRNFNYTIHVSDVFKGGTIRGLSSLIESNRTDIMPVIEHDISRHGFYPLSFQQEQMWIIDNLEGSMPYHIDIHYIITGQIDLELIEKSLNLLIERHEILRSVIGMENGGVTQSLVQTQFRLEMFEDSDDTAKFYSSSFDLSRQIPIRVAVYHKSRDEFHLYLRLHHIAADGWSLSVLINELAAIYVGQLEGREEVLPRNSISYIDYALWQRGQLNSSTWRSGLAYWQAKLKGAEPVGFPIDKRYPAYPSRKGNAESFFIAPEVYRLITAFCKREKLTPYIFVLSALKILISKYNNGAEDVCIGSVLANRNLQQMSGLFGYFANTVALRTEFDEEIQLFDLFGLVKETVLNAIKYGDLPYELVVDALEVKRSASMNPFFNVMLVFQDSTIPESITTGSGFWALQPPVRTTSKFDLLWDVTQKNEGLEIILEYNTDIYEIQTISGIIEQYSHLIQNILTFSRSEKISKLPWLSCDFSQNLTDSMNVAYPKQSTLITAFSDVAGRFSSNVAVSYEDRSLSYGELDSYSNRLAHYLIGEGIKRGSLVPLCLDRSLEMIIGILAIMKAGGAYVPIDPLYPQERIRYMLEDTGSELLMTSSEVILETPLRKVLVDTDIWHNASEAAVISGITPEDLAYVIYTSGSTGRPKGVMIEHRNVIRLFFNERPLFDFGSDDVWCLFHSYCFDFSVWEMYGALLYGGRLAIVPRSLLNAIDFLPFLEKNKVSVLNQTPTAFYALQEQVNQQSGGGLQVRYVIYGGEALNPAKLSVWKSLFPSCKLVNMYGITETTVHVTHKEITTKEIDAGLSNIGVPIPTLGCLVLDKSFNIMPVGVPGELFVSGDGLARGYLHNSELTSSRFISSPFEDSDRLYRTGDLVRWQHDGTLEYLGRIDDQVKIRGYRIELGEIETVLQRTGLVDQCVVVAREGKLIGYVVSPEFDRAAILSGLHLHLPDYMVPSILVPVEHIPMTSNGKVDRKALPEASLLLETGYEQPHNETEAVLCGIWQELLGLEKVGVNDNFFEIGGDSIVSIQVVSRARHLGIYLQPRDIFRCQTIRLLTAGLTATDIFQSEQGELSGSAGLLPIQHWFFSQDHASISHYNQSLLLGIDKSAGVSLLQGIFTELLSHHDALRFRYRKTGEEWEQWYDRSFVQVEEVMLESEDLPEVCSVYQQQLSITEGPLLRVVLLKTGTAVPHNLLLVVAHHLCVDGVSWRILSEDLHNCLDASLSGKPLDLGTKGSSYRQWYAALHRYAGSSSLDSQYPYWKATLNGYHPLPVDHELSGARLIHTMKRKEVRISAALTRLLLQEVHATYHTDVKDILMSALALTLQEWTGLNQQMIGMEGHGREDLGSEIDLNRTIGWFTTLYPVLLELDGGLVPDYGRQISSIKEQLRQVPVQGLGYGVLRYLHADEVVRSQMASVKQADIVFNYLGRLGNLVNNSSWLSQPADIILSAGALSDMDNVYDFRLGVDSYIYQDRLTLIWSYSTGEYEAGTIDRLAASYLQHLEVLIEHCMGHSEQGYYTPSDYRLGGKLTIKELHSLNSKFGTAGLNELYGLSSLQEGMLFHGLYDSSSGTYVEQFSCLLDNVVPDLLKAAWEQVISGYSILRSSFHYEELHTPIQRVHSAVQLPFELHDFQHMDQNVQAVAVEAFLLSDRLRGFDFNTAPLMRVQLLQLSSRHSRMIWTFHHILLDGWSVPLVISNLQAAYGRLLAGDKPLHLPEDNYGDFIHYLQLRDRFSEQQYWRNYLSGFDTPSLLPFAINASFRNQGTGLIGTEILELDEAFTTSVNRYAQQQHITVNTIIQGVWSYLLSAYTGQEDVLFGVTVSGRPAELENADRRVGLYIHTIPQRSVLPGSGSFMEWLSVIQHAQTASREHPYIPLTTIQELLGIKGDLFDSLLVFENFPVYATTGAGTGLGLSDIRLAEHTNYLLTIIVEPGARLRLSFSYNGELMTTDQVAAIAAHFKYVLTQLINDPGILLSDISLADPAEKLRLNAFQGESAYFPEHSTLIDLFTQSSYLHADAVAVSYEDRSLSYGELDSYSNRLAHYLIGEGIKRGSLVPLCLDRSLEMIIGILAIMKAGGAYVPIDPLYPQERIRYMLEDTGSELLMTSSEVILETPLRKVLVDTDIWHNASEAAVISGITPEDLAYVIYTSGSTGRPKGVMIEHRGVVNRLHWAGSYYKLGNSDVILQKTTFCFDVSVWELLLPLLYGSRLVFARPGGQRDNSYLKQIIDQEGVTMIHFVPGMLEVFMPDVAPGECTSLRQVICSGEALKPEQAVMFSQKLGHASLYNLYGPTEAAIDVTCWHVPLNPVPDRVLIGSAIANVSLYVLNKDLGLQPVGIAGELYIGGVQVSRGYLHNSELTSSRFISSPFEDSDRLYRTGDLVRWQHDGTLEYLGRIDDQVKIRGYRIELGEIETVLQRTGLVDQCVVVAREGKLIGYVVSPEFDRAAILSGLHLHLPDYMVPSILVPVEHIPMTSNGKVDRKALPEASLLLETGYEQPHNETEAVLCGIWQELLGLEKVGVNDNFFEIGGDSIVSIQVVSRARHLGIYLQPRDIFRCQTIRLLTAGLTATDIFQSEQGELSGSAGLLPIQHWFFSQDHASISHYNQSLLLGIDKSAGVSLLQGIFTELLSHHDALRFRYRKTGEEWEQWYDRSFVQVEEVMLESEDLPEVCSVYQQQLSITEGPLLRVVLLKTGTAVPHNLLLVVAHHLCVDGVSWRILSEDLHNCLDASLSGKPLDLGTKGSSYRQWYAALHRYAGSSSLDSQYPYWKATLNGYHPLPVDHELSGARLIHTMKRKEVRISAALTRLLLQEVHATYHTDVKDILMSALALTLQEWTGLNQQMIGMEGHGREDLGSEIDLNRTIGWFTTLYPVLLELDGGLVPDYGRQISSIKEQLRQVPVQGLGYGVLRYLHADEVVRSQMASVKQADIVFNYLGRLGNLVNNSSWLSQPADIILSAGALSDMDNVYDFRLGVDSYIYQDRLTLIWSYSTGEYEAGTIDRLAASYLQHLEVLIEHCMGHSEQGYYTPSDYRLGGKLTIKELHSLNSKFGTAGLNELYGLSSLQEGMLFHGLYDSSSGTYVEQFSCLLDNVVPDLLKAAWEQVISGYSILRSSFHYEELHTPIQRVHSAVQLPFELHDFQHMDQNVQAVAVEAFLLSDRLRGFDFNTAPLMRVQLLQLSSRHSRMIWTFHHILLDGWSVPLVISNLQAAYGRLLAGDKPLHLPEDNYGDFIHYLQLRDRFSEQQYWRNYLSGFDTPSLLPFAINASFRNQGTGLIGTEILELDEAFTTSVNRYAQQQHITVNTIIQGVWSYLLSAYTGQEDVLFGVTVSGRPAELENADRRVGLYIHTIPQRSVLPGSGSFMEWLSVIQHAQTASREHPYIPLTTIQELLGIKGDLFDSLLVFENFPVYATTGAGTGLGLSDIRLAEHTNYLLTIIVEPGARLRLSFSYNGELMTTDQVAAIAAHFKYVLTQLINDPGILLSDISLADPAEKLRLNAFQGESAYFPEHSTLIDLFTQSSYLHADAVAVSYEDRSLSYGELDSYSNRLAHYLIGEGIKRGSLVPLCLDRSLEMIIGILAIMKAGGAYVPIDPLYPQERIRYMLEDTGSELLMTSSEVILETPLRKVLVDTDIWHNASEAAVISGITPEDLAYVIYTSGSTGRPKGVMIEHRGVVNRLHWAGSYYKLGNSDVILQKTTFCFDVSVWELLLPLLYGSRLVFARPGGQRDNSYLKQIIDQEGVTMIHFVPGMLEVFMPDVAPGECTSLRQVICSGEALKPEQAVMFSQKLGHASLYNLYGPTEAAIDVTCWHVPLNPVPDRVLIGSAIANVSLYVLNKDLGLQPVGIAGELYIGGVQVSRGYLHNSELTSSRFISSPFEDSDRLYRTGDLVRWQHDGTLEYLGRIDDQVKIRGYRIELGEIETVLQRTGLVDQCVVVAREGKLIGYVVSPEFDRAAILSGLHLHLPDYMVPSILVPVEHIPMTSNGKVDRKALPEASLLLETGYEQPHNETEAVLCGIWQELLGLEKVGVNDNFFEIGGDSISIIRLFQRLNKHFGKIMNVSDLFKHNSIQLQAAAITGKFTPEDQQIEV
ncbi:amino acid adenylation domain-containing protein [Mucilaginibacter sp. E4BP6]|uniref:amino acid adenylation domain-containing protein n=1 Tax=Mucilaginibacter sp. E4BP6 TaxID=2723089 RepID=UPI003AFFDB25